ncbi:MULTISPECIES: hypothetical protein [unclassified Thermoactinomyces]|jgi:hypothetical protein|nr:MULTISPECIES: hypothetical protein [unclassified Thermoactinomyces]
MTEKSLTLELEEIETCEKLQEDTEDQAVNNGSLQIVHMLYAK